ncbi:MAG: SDR family NAD(P)-dependent oxidoreductase [Anaerolineaceae bacterium]|nr:SDR family NAD(P)-dependent oxidoreductase [Anaerolineaceae bacterium]
MKYLVTGGAGFIGSHLVRALLQEGAQVRILDDLSTGRRENIEGLNAEVVEGDLRDPTRVNEAVQGVLGTARGKGSFPASPSSRFVQGLVHDLSSVEP